MQIHVRRIDCLVRAGIFLFLLIILCGAVPVRPVAVKSGDFSGEYQKCSSEIEEPKISIDYPVDQANKNATFPANRRLVLQRLAKTTVLFPSAVLSPPPALADTTDAAITSNVGTSPIHVENDKVAVPLEYIPALNAYVVHYYLFGERFGAIVDTGSPFLTCPSTCSSWSYKYKWGCYHPELTQDSGYSDTIVFLSNNQGPVVWRKAGFTFHELQPPMDLVFGVFGPELLDGPGGVFFGLIKDTAKWIRPSFLGQTGYSSFCVDLRQTSPQLVLSKQPLIEGDDYIPLVRDLNKRYKAPVVHYAAKAAGFVVNGLPLYLDGKRPTYVIFDTGLSGMAVSEELFEGRYLQARKNREKSLWGKVSVAFTTHAGKEVELTATKPITTPLGKDTPWTRFKGNLIVLGLAFLDGNAMTIDIDDNKLRFEK